MTSTSRHHSIDYVELTVTDMARAQRFYNDAFGWTFNDYGPEYSGIRRDGGESGGLTVGESVIPGGPLIILFSDNLDATLERVVAAGGEIVTPPFEFPGGKRFHFKDVSGNVLAVWTEQD